MQTATADKARCEIYPLPMRRPDVGEGLLFMNRI